MSSVEARDRSSQAIKIMRETYNKNKASTAKKHAEEIRRLTQQFYDEVEGLKSNHKAYVKDVQSKNRQTVSSKEQKHQVEIEKMRTAHRKQVEGMSSQHHDEKKRGMQAHRGDINKLQQISDQQQNILRKEYEGKLKRQIKFFDDYVKSQRVSRKRELNTFRDKVNKRHSEEIGSIRKSVDDRIAGLQLKNEDLRITGQAKYEELKRHASHRDEISQMKFMSTIEKERKEKAAAIEAQMNASDSAVKRIKDKYNKNLKEKTLEIEEANKSFKDNISHRVENKLHMMKNRIAKLKEQKTVDEVKRNREFARQKQTLIQEHQKQIDIFNQQRSDIVKDANLQTQKEIGRLQRKSNKQLRDTNHFYNSKMRMTNLSNQEAMAQKNLLHNSQISHVKGQSQNRVNRLLKETQVKEERLNAYFENLTDIMKKTHQEKLRDERIKSIQERSAVVQRLTEHLRKSEAEANEKLSRTVSHYQSEIEKLRDTQKVNDNLMKKKADRQVKQLKKGHELTLRTVNERFQAQVEQMKENHQRELEGTQRRHAEQINQLIAANKKPDDSKA